jgi:hypothetical protein
MREHPDETAGWDVVYDHRGHLTEPHTGHRICIGTLAVHKYLREAAKSPTLPTVALPDLSFHLSTTGPRHRYGGILFIEREGFFPLLERVQIAECYDLAIISTKGMGSTSARRLIERLAPETRIFVLLLAPFRFRRVSCNCHHSYSGCTPAGVEWEFQK